MANHIQICAECDASVSCTVCHLGFGGLEAIYCSCCPKVLLLDQAQGGTQLPNLKAGDEGWEEFDRHLLRYFSEAEKNFPPCSCGGFFQFMNPPRCPKCEGLLFGQDYENKPIQRNLGYAYITSGSISMEELGTGWRLNKGRDDS